MDRDEKKKWFRAVVVETLSVFDAEVDRKIDFVNQMGRRGIDIPAGEIKFLNREDAILI